MKNKNKGFTLLELIIVIVILASLGGIIFGAINGVRGIVEDEPAPQEEYVEEVPAPPVDSPEVEQLKIQNEILRKLVEQKQAEKP